MPKPREQQPSPSGERVAVGEYDDRGGATGKPAAAQESEQQTEPAEPLNGPASQPWLAVAVTGGGALTGDLPGVCPRGRRRSASATDAELDHVAELGDRAAARGRDVLGEIVEHCGITRKTAGDWREAARRRRAAARQAVSS